MPQRRKYALVKLHRGDYLCISNDRQKVWRFRAYEDGRVGGLDVPFESRTFWSVSWVDYDLAQREWLKLDDFYAVDDLPWFYVHDSLASRKDAINVMLDY